MRSSTACLTYGSRIITLTRITFDPLIRGIDPTIQSNILQHLLGDLSRGLKVGTWTRGFALPSSHTQICHILTVSGQLFLETMSSVSHNERGTCRSARQPNAEGLIRRNFSRSEDAKVVCVAFFEEG